MDDARFLQQVLGYLGADHGSAAGELHFQVLSEAAGVVVDDGASVPESLHQAVDQQDFLLEGPVVGLDWTEVHQSSRQGKFSRTALEGRGLSLTHLPENGQLLHQQVSALCFSCSTFPADHHTLHTGGHQDDKAAPK